MLHELVYVSRATRPDMPASELRDLLRQARRKNLELGITGVLLYEKGEFIQLLEGERRAVTTLFHHAIACDPRHRRVFLCWENDKKARNFGQWQMGFATGEELAGADLPGLEGYLREGIAGLDLSSTRSTGRDLLLSLYETVATA